MSTPSLAISHIAAAQNSKEVTANAAFDALDSSVNAQVSIAMANADVILTQAQLASGGVLQFTGALTADRYVNVPAVARAFIVRNSTTGGFNIIVQVVGGGGSSVSIAASIVALYCDSLSVFAIGGSVVSGGGGGGGTGNTAYDIIPTGTIDGSNAVFTLPTAPTPAHSLQLFKNGRKMLADGIDFTLSGATITYATGSIPQAGTTPDVHIAGSFTY